MLSPSTQADEVQRLRQRVAELQRWRRRVVDSSFLGILVWEDEGRIVEANQASADMLGYAADELAESSVTLASLTPPKYRPLDVRAQEQIDRHGACFPYEKRMRRRDGAEVAVLVGGASLPERGRRRISFLLDISDRKNAEEALQQSEERFRILARNVPGVVYLCRNDRRYTMLFLNEAVRDLTGIPARDFLEERVSFVDLYHPEDSEEIVAKVDAALGRHRPFHLHYRLRGPEGQWHWVEERGQGVYDSFGNLEFLEGTIIDITARKRVEDTLRRHNEMLERRVEERTQRMREANARLQREVTERTRAEEALRAERALLLETLDKHEAERKLVSYEIHDGLAQYVTGAIMQLECCAAESADASTDGAPSAELNEALRLLRETLSEARRLISGLRPPILDEEGIVAAIEYLIQERGGAVESIDFVHDVQFDRLAPLLENALFRITQEALTNIRRHSGARRARVELGQAYDRVRLEIRDWGRGFDAAYVTERSFGLRGIRERARLMGGTAKIESWPGRGTRITVVLPVVPDYHDA